MKVRKSLVLASIAGGLSVCMAPALAQQVVYDNTVAAPTFYTIFVPAGAATGHERGDEVNLDGDSRELSEISIMYFSQTGAGSATVRVRIYDDPGPTGTVPGPILWDSGDLPNTPHTAGVNNLILPIPNVNVSDTVIWTIAMSNRTGSTGDIGTLTVHPPLIGSSGDWFWAYDAPNFPGWATLWFGGDPYANFGAKLTATGTILSGACCLPDGSCDSMTASACSAAGGVWEGGNTLCINVICPEPGACCMPDGTCMSVVELSCTNSGGIFQGVGIPCTTGLCPAPGACCFTDGSCVVASNNQCTAAGGTYNGDGTLCGPVSCSSEPILLRNGPLSTGEFTTGLAQAPAGTTWSELQEEIFCPATIAGFGIVGTARLADNFIVPGNQGWNIEKVYIHAYQTLAVGATHPPGPSPFTSGTVRIWNGRPGTTGATVIWGDTTTNRLASSEFANIYRVFQNPVPDAFYQRPVYRNELTVNTHVPPGEYWIDFGLAVASGGGFSPSVTLIGARGPDGGNAVQQTEPNGPWNFIVDAGPTSCNIPRRQEVAFVLHGTEGPPDPTGCYANCDNSTTPPILNVEDFTCFINQFAAGLQLPPAQQINHYSNCDNSTTQPVLNVEDFTCFINKFAAGC